MQSHTIHFPGLNNLRLLAALSVLVFHVEDKKRLLGFEYRWLERLTIVGDLGVTLFFVLSGFLITYLLLAERQATASVSIKKFYMRRILRIWPLYYFILLLGFFVLPYIPFFQIPTTSLVNPADAGQLALFFLFFANIGFMRYGNLAYVDQTWSVAVEEQFYLVWPIILKYVRNILPVLLLVIVLFVGARMYVSVNYLEGEIFRKAYALLYYLRIDNMAVGGLFAWWLFTKNAGITALLSNKILQIICLALTVALWFLGYVIPYVHHLAYAVLFGIVIFNSANGSFIVAVKSKALHYLGKISYGIYMYHNILIVVALKLCAEIIPASSTKTFFIASYAFSIVLTIIVAHLSYAYFERFFLGLKKRFAVVQSAD